MRSEAHEAPGEIEAPTRRPRCGEMVEAPRLVCRPGSTNYLDYTATGTLKSRFAPSFLCEQQFPKS
jgi:hypothetical protein